jgi:pilus assembly protein CpaE
VLDVQAFANDLRRQDVNNVLSAEPNIIFLDLGKDVTGLRALQGLSHKAPDVTLVVAGPKLSAEELLAVMRAGATEYLPRPFSGEETLGAFNRARRRATPHSVEAPGTEGRVTTVFSAKGGTGVTTVATNLAVAIQRATGGETLLMDLAPCLGTAAAAIGLQPRYTYLDVIKNFHRIDVELLRSFLEVHESGVNVLASPLDPEQAVAPGHDEIESLIRLCKSHFNHVIIDAGSSLSDRLEGVLEESDQRVLVMTPELPTLRNLKWALDLYGKTNGKSSPPRLVLNQFQDGVGLSTRDVQQGLGYRVAAVLEKDDQNVAQSINLGRPVVLVGKSRLSKSIVNLGNQLVGAERSAERRSSFIGKLFSGSKDTKKSGKEKK